MAGNNRNPVALETLISEWRAVAAAFPGWCRRAGRAPTPNTRTQEAEISAPLIWSVQAALSERGYRADPIGADMGGRTQAAIRAYQRDAGLPETGLPSADLLRRIREP